MPHLPLEDNCQDVIAKAQRGLGISDADLARRAEVSLEDLQALQAGQAKDAVLRRVARHLGLSPDALEALAHQRWYPRIPDFPIAFAAFSTRHGEMLVNSYLIWDPRAKIAAAFDTGADCTAMLDIIATEGLRLHYIFLTHTHPDHIADLPRLAEATGALAVKTLLTSGHSPGQTTFYVTGLSWPLAVVGDSIFASSMGGSATHFKDQLRNNRRKILSLPRDTVLACGHGPLTTLDQEKVHNPFFAR
jgi:glyoxylase-like metal-dependent hydrolase (beta-lactamase superfamily II)